MILKLMGSNAYPVDPLTRTEIKKDAIYNNNSITEAVVWYSKNHPEEVFLSDKKEIEF